MNDDDDDVRLMTSPCSHTAADSSQPDSKLVPPPPLPVGFDHVHTESDMITYKVNG